MYRGLNKSDTFPSSSPSIPSKYQTVVVTNPEKKGFSSQAKRFFSAVCQNENPGPGSYDCIITAEVNSPSFSKKGTTGFVPAKVTRRPQSISPGPNAYNLQSSLITKCDFNTGSSRLFRLPVAVQMDGPKHKTPAPNQYDVLYENKEKAFSAAGTSAFLSKTRRLTMSLNKDTPSPGHYDVKDTVIQHSSKAIMSPFKSKTKRIPALANNYVPGPGAYTPYQGPEPLKRAIHPRRYFLAVSAPPVIIPKDPPLPGPGQYDIRNNIRPSNHPLPTAAFASRTERIHRSLQTDVNPGPGFYDPQILKKQSFFYNDSRVWLPV
ncbi:O(6)-methylguanine-induced apoptosis 2 [Gouania willdenowi]|uniref:O(6)-methylguanine-induced apoptosis 2 n=1 Tax=Gouania willdenowi TaxID=441366 RepID=UPI00105419AA|nr:O(6)-methylguanine-induced apoptosis 2 [Gouania willdenowi]